MRFAAERAFRRSAIKAELTFAPYTLMKAVIHLLFEKPKNLNMIGISMSHASSIPYVLTYRGMIFFHKVQILLHTIFLFRKISHSC